MTNPWEAVSDGSGRSPLANILVIDDEESLRSMFKSYLESCGFAVRLADDGVSGTALFEAGQFDLIILDILMPNKNGYEVIRDIRSVDPKIKVLAISGGTFELTSDYLKPAEELGADLTMKKPIEMPEMVKEIHNLLGLVIEDEETTSSGESTT